MIITRIPAHVTLDAMARNLSILAGRNLCRVIIGDGPSSRSLNFKLEFDRVADPSEATRRRSASGRKTIGVKWSTCYAVLKALFDIYPDVTVKTALITYKGKADFERNYQSTFNKECRGAGHSVSFGEL